MPSFASVVTSQMEMTPMRVSYKAPEALTAVDLGGTLENIVITMNYKKAELKADQSGSTVRDRRVSGIEVKVTTRLTQIQDKEIWKVVFPHATLVEEAGPPAQEAIVWSQAIGDSDLANAGELTLHPLSKENADVDTDYTFFKACASAESEVTYGPEQQASLNVVWNILPDESTTPERFFCYGDVAIL